MSNQPSLPERQGLVAWLRGEAADRLGCADPDCGGCREEATRYIAAADAIEHALHVTITDALNEPTRCRVNAWTGALIFDGVDLAYALAAAPAATDAPVGPSTADRLAEAERLLRTASLVVRRLVVDPMYPVTTAERGYAGEEVAAIDAFLAAALADRPTPLALLAAAGAMSVDVWSSRGGWKARGLGRIVCDNPDPDTALAALADAVAPSGLLSAEKDEQG